MKLLFFTFRSKIISYLYKLLVWSWIVFPQDEITFQQVPYIKTALNLMPFPFAVEVVPAAAARLRQPRALRSGSTCDVPARSSGLPRPPCFHDPSQAWVLVGRDGENSREK